MKWKTTLALMLATIGIGAFISLYEIRQPSPEERERHSRVLVSIPSESVSQIELHTPSVTVSLSRDGTRWRLGPQRLRANEELIGQLLNETASLTAQRIFPASPEKPLDLKAFGLDPAVARLTLTADGTATTRLLGETTPVHNNRYVKRADRPQVAVIAPTLFVVINHPAEEFRDPLLIRFDTWMTDSLTITSPARALTVAHSGMDWRLISPLNDRADRTEVMNLLNSVSGLRIARVLEETPQVEQLSTWGLDAPKAEVTLTLRDEQAASPTVFFGKPLPEDSSLVYAKRSDEPALYAVSATAVDALLQDPNGLRAKACLEFFTSEVTKIEVLQGTTGWTIERKDGVWNSVSDTKLTALDTARVEGFLNAVADLRLTGFVDEHPQDLARYGLEPPAGTISVWTTNPEKPQRLLVGTTIEGSTNRYGRMEGREAVVSLPGTITGLLQTSLDQFRPPAAAASPQPPSASPPTPPANK